MSGKAVIKEPRRVFDRFFKVDEVDVVFEGTDGKMVEQTRLVLERGDAVGVLLLNLDTQCVVLVEQFKVPVVFGRRRDDPSTTDGWVTETVAGMIDANETPEAAAIRETMEETGYQVRQPKLIAKFLSSPGGTSERIFLYFAEVRERDKLAKGGGIDDENIKLVQMSLEDLFDRLAKGSIEDPKLLIAGYWLQDRVKATDDRSRLIDAFWRRHGAASGAQPASAPASQAAAALPPSGRGPLTLSTVRFPFKYKEGLVVGYKTGAIDRIKGVDLWVNSENTDMMMDRFLGRSISANIRYLGANKDEHDNVVEDTIEEALRTAVGRRAHVKVGTVLVTESGALRTTHRVRKLFHVATVEGIGAGRGVKADATKLALCIDRLLQRVDEENNRTWRVLSRRIPLLGMSPFDSILIPMLGAGDGGLSVEEVAQIIIPPAVEYFQHTDQPTLKQIYFLAYTTRDKNACDRVLEQFRSDGVLS